MKAFRRFVGLIWLAALAGCALAAISPEESITQRVLSVAYTFLLCAAFLVLLIDLIAWLVAAVTGKLDEGRQESASESSAGTQKTSTALRTTRLSWQVQLAAIPLATLLSVMARDNQYVGGFVFFISLAAGLAASVSALVRARDSHAVVAHAIAGLTIVALLGGTVLHTILTFKS
jgi:hypothetical protein